MNIKNILSKSLHVLAAIGVATIILSNLYYFYGIFSWGVRNDWHFQYVSGWGFRGAFCFEVIILGLLMITPFWVFGKNDATSAYLPNRKRINTGIAIGLLLFTLAVAMESLLQKTFP